MKRFSLIGVVLLCQFLVLLFGQQTLWQEDFRHQPIVIRPELEVNYSDAFRTAYQILAQQYRLTESRCSVWLAPTPVVLSLARTSESA